MKTRKFKDGEIIYAEGDRSDSAYIVQSGRVDLYHDSRAGPVLMGTATRDELFGELGLLDNSPRTATAYASGDVAVKVIPRREFLRRIEDDPATAMKVMSKLAQRLRETDDRAAIAYWGGDEDGAAGSGRRRRGGEATNLPVPVDAYGLPELSVLAEPRRPTLLARLFGRWRSSSGEKRDGAVRPFEVLVAPFANDPEDTQRPHLIAWLEQLEGFSIRAHGTPLPAEADLLLMPGEQARRANASAQRWLAEERADLVLWGAVDGEGRMDRIHMTAASLSEEERAGRPHPLLWLPVPCYFDESWAALVQSVVMAAIEPRGEAQAQSLATRLPGWLEAARVFIDTPVEGLYQIETAQIFACYGIACAAAGTLSPGTGLQEYGADVLRAAVEWTPQEDAEVWYCLQRQLALVYQAVGERTGNAEYLHAAAEGFRNAIYGTERSVAPVEWAGLHNRLGTVLFRLDMTEGNVDALREAVGAFQHALTVFTRANFPWHWADVMHNVSQVLQVYGDQHKNQEVLERAVGTSRNALTVRDPSTTPILWAASRNSLGTALFLLAKHTRDPKPLDQAVACFSDAVEIYRGHGAGMLARVAEKNLGRAEGLLRRLGGEVAAREGDMTD
ncbi:cyclic nucleotide-binding domain-containing protein [Caenispirillum salinarum]|uniref:cyclic nucleotide-binding domain-containing protein n=1 Tax=Caenispirillum salinarum TaxID=859058 RepID=UPI003850E890